MRPEEKIELEFVKKCKQQFGIDAHKFEIRNKKGPPDRILFLSEARTIFIEFKRPGLREDGLSHHQIEFIKDLTKRKFPVLVTDSVEEALTFVKHQIGDSR